MRALSILAAGMVLCGSIIAVRSVLHSCASPEGCCSGKRGVEGVERIDEAPRSQIELLESGSAVTPLSIGDRVPDAALVDQDGRDFRLHDLKGDTVVLSFIYTHCNVSTMCPLATAKLVDTQRLVKKLGLPDVHFLLVSFDEKRDHPRRLKAFAALYGPDLSSFTLATGEAAVIAQLSRRLNTYYREASTGIFEHNIIVSLLDGTGILRDDFFGTNWEPGELVGAIEKIAGTGGT